MKKGAGIKAEYHGICPSCENFVLCSYTQGSRESVTFCEEFISSRITTTTKFAGIHRGTHREKAYSKEYRGLCANCENLDDCVFPKDQAGIWHCENYK